MTGPEPGSTGPLTIDDGSAVNVEITLPSGAAPPGWGAVVVVTGVVSSIAEMPLTPEGAPAGDEIIRPLILARDVQIVLPPPP